MQTQDVVGLTISWREPRERTRFERFVDFFVGPRQRYNLFAINIPHAEIHLSMSRAATPYGLSKYADRVMPFGTEDISGSFRAVGPPRREQCVAEELFIVSALREHQAGDDGCTLRIGDHITMEHATLHPEAILNRPL